MAQINMTSTIESGDKADKKSENLVNGWLEKISDARKRERDFRKFGQIVCDLYEAEKSAESPYNILFSNTETLAPALYNSLPRPVVRRRFKDEDPVGKAASALVQRTLTFLLDSDNRDYPPFDDLMQSAVLEALVPGRGVTRFRYDAAITTVKDESAGEDLGEPAAVSYEKVEHETVCGEAVIWDRFLHGFATKWKDVPWIAFEWPMTKVELEKNFGAILTSKCDLVDIETPSEDESGAGKLSTETSTKGAWVLEIWDKASRKVIFVSESFKDAPLKLVEDPLGLSGFFPCPQPMGFVRRIRSLIPVALYSFYEQQAKELNQVTVRIKNIIAALKVRGFYDSTIEGIDRVMEATDNTLIPADNVAAMQQGMSLEKAIFLMPIDKLVAVLQQLYLQRQQIKQVIYEITGIADIMRGSTVASETLGAQELKNQWGTLRLKKAQKEVARYARDCLRIMAEIAVTKLSPETLRSMTGLPFPMQAEKVQAQTLVQQFAVSGQQPPPQVISALQQPTVEDLLAMLKDDLQRAYRIDIETNSTVDAEATEDKKDIGELTNAIAQFLNGVAPAVQEGILPFEAAKGILLGIVRRFRFGDDVEDLLKEAQPPQQPGGPDPKALEAQAQDLQKQQQELEKGKQALQMEAAKQQMQLDFSRKEFELEVKLAHKELAAEQAAHAKSLALEGAAKEAGFAIKQHAETQKFAQQKSDFEASARKREQGIQAAEGQTKAAAASLPTAEQIIQPLSDQLAQGLAQIESTLQQGLAAIINVKRKAVKQPDGSWLATTSE